MKTFRNLMLLLLATSFLSSCYVQGEGGPRHHRHHHDGGYYRGY